MPLQNRVDPYGRLHAVAARGAWMGNRGVLHDAKREIVAPWRGKRWITCSLSFRGRKRTVFTPGRYSELFFLDEATAYAAGHRPCAECRREDFKRFRAAWRGKKSSVDDIDAVLHAERTGRRSCEAPAADLPTGTFVDAGAPFLVCAAKLVPWTFEGYGAPIAAPKDEVRVLTPRSIVQLFRDGLEPQIHPSAQRAR
ncbi:MAG: hypothetical protein ACT4P4_25575 [Betaproteobacteria bacterium]